MHSENEFSWLYEFKHLTWGHNPLDMHCSLSPVSVEIYIRSDQLSYCNYRKRIKLHPPRPLNVPPPSHFSLHCFLCLKYLLSNWPLAMKQVRGPLPFSESISNQTSSRELSQILLPEINLFLPKFSIILRLHRFFRTHQGPLWAIIVYTCVSSIWFCIIFRRQSLYPTFLESFASHNIKHIGLQRKCSILFK